MLDFWYSEKCTREIKLMACIITCAIIYFCSSIQQLSPLFTGLSLAIGICIHSLRNISFKISADSPYAQGFKILFAILPMSTLIFLMTLLPTEHKLYLAIQCVGFTAIGLFMLSIYENRAKRFE